MWLILVQWLPFLVCVYLVGWCDGTAQANKRAAKKSEKI